MKVQAGKPEEGPKLLRKAEALHASPAPTNFYLGLGLAEIGQTAEAAQWFERSLANQPSPFIQQSAYYQLARAYQKLELMPNALSPSWKTQNRSKQRPSRAARRADNSNSCSLVSDTAAMSLLLQLRYERTRPSVSLVAAMSEAEISISIQAQQPPAACPAGKSASATCIASASAVPSCSCVPICQVHPNDPETLTLSGQLRIDQGDQLGAVPRCSHRQSQLHRPQPRHGRPPRSPCIATRRPWIASRLLAIAPANPNARLVIRHRACAHRLAAPVILKLPSRLPARSQKAPRRPRISSNSASRQPSSTCIPQRKRLSTPLATCAPACPGTLYALARMETERQHLPAAEADSSISQHSPMTLAHSSASVTSSPCNKRTAEACAEFGALHSASARSN